MNIKTFLISLLLYIIGVSLTSCSSGILDEDQCDYLVVIDKVESSRFNLDIVEVADCVNAFRIRFHVKRNALRVGDEIYINNPEQSLNDTTELITPVERKPKYIYEVIYRDEKINTTEMIECVDCFFTVEPPSAGYNILTVNVSGQMPVISVVTESLIYDIPVGDGDAIQIKKKMIID